MSADAPIEPARCLVIPSDSVLAAPGKLALASEALLSGDTDAAREHLLDIDRIALWTYWFAAGNEYGQRHSEAAHVSGASVAAPPAPSVKRAVLERDRWRCRYCGMRVIDSRLLATLGKFLPTAFPWTYRNADSHPAGLVLAATPDHVDPRAGGGDSSPENLVTACGVCQYNKGSCTLDELRLADPRDTPPTENGWDGLSNQVQAFRSLLPADNRPVDVDFELEYLVTYGRIAGQLPAVKHPALVDKLVRIFEAALPGAPTA